MIFTEIRHQAEKGECYLGSPAILRLRDGALLVSHDYFGKGAPCGPDGKSGLTSLYRSEDNGATWENIGHLMNMSSGTFFEYEDSVYMLGLSRVDGDIIIRRSDNGGFSWTTPSDGETGLLFPAGKGGSLPRYHGGNFPFIHNGRVYRAVENRTSDLRGFRDFRSLVISAPLDSDLLASSSWTMSNSLLLDAKSWLPDFDQFEESSYGLTGWGWLEGQVISSPDGRLFNLLRVSSPLRKWAGHEDSVHDPVFNQERADACENSDHAAMVEILDEGKKVVFRPPEALITLPGGGIGRFRIQRDPGTGLYLSLVNRTPDPERKFRYWRNILSLAYSRDLVHWRIAGKVLEDDSGLSMADSRNLTGFQYPDWLFDGKDLLILSRTAYRGAHTAHDSNRLTFHVLKNYQKMIEDHSRSSFASARRTDEKTDS